MSEENKPKIDAPADPRAVAHLVSTERLGNVMVQIYLDARHIETPNLIAKIARFSPADPSFWSLEDLSALAALIPQVQERAMLLMSEVHSPPDEHLRNVRERLAEIQAAKKAEPAAAEDEG